MKVFLARFPEFKDEIEGGKEVMTLTLASAESELNRHIWGSLFEEGVLFLAADKLMRTSIGETLRDPDDPASKSVYAQEFERLARIVSMGARVI